MPTCKAIFKALAASSDAPVDEVSFTVYELYQLTSQAAVQLLGSDLDMQQHIQPLCSSQALQLQPPVQPP